ncbi:hypothetical protein VHUM_01966 [Vanrija humicola]|uniref:AMP-dependent synthetase/ligase domain-containing protein n=1 Tax=Vanrija humicola TaxID=5417 RepID=A0A7D8Z0H1_VANHU|nr:hypothetical protein VHUM_01966 [Vanrija humicola]
MASQLSSYPLLARIAAHAQTSPASPAITDVPASLEVSYGALASDVVSLGGAIVRALVPGAENDVGEARVAVLCDKGYLVPLALLSTWAAGGFAIPVLPALPVPEQAYLVNNGDVALIITDGKNRARADELARVKEGGVPCAVLEISLESVREGASADAVPDPAAHLASRPPIAGDRRAMMLYTSGTTGRPKGVVTRHSALAAQAESVVTAWRWTSADNLLHVLPLNHLHGIVVALLPTLWAGAAVEMWERFDGAKVWLRWINAEGKRPISMFFAVPTVYTRLIEAHEKLDADTRAAASRASATLRLQVSGSAPLPESVKAAWEKEGGVGGGQVLLERYGMTETGLIATTGWENEKRVKGCVGFPMPSVSIRLWDTESNVLVSARDTPGEVQVSGPGIMREYWRLPEATAKEITPDGWFKTGDVAVWSGAQGAPEAEGMLRILGRSSQDIIKSGGEKISAIEIERAILELEGMKDAAVVGVPDDVWGQVVAACIVTTRSELSLASLRDELRAELAAFKLPRKLKVFDTIPRNAMGKIQKKIIVQNEFVAPAAA